MDPRERFDPNEATADEPAPDPLTSTDDVRTTGTTQFVPGADAAAIGPSGSAETTASGAAGESAGTGSGTGTGAEGSAGGD